ncbi:MAG: hypothetical protein WC326_02860 [Candidatus Delongbacteria bacterium]
MPAQPDPRQALGSRVRARRAAIRAWIHRAGPRASRLTNLSIVGSGLSGLLTIGPAAGGPSATAAITKALSLDAPVWQLLCGAAALSSFAASTALLLIKSHDVSGRLARAESADVKLEGLELSLELDSVDLSRASELYTQASAEVAFIREGESA